MRKATLHKPITVTVTVSVATLAVCTSTGQAQVSHQQVINDLIAYYPLDSIDPYSMTTPDYIGDRDLILYRMDADNVIPSDRGRVAASNCFNFTQSGGATVIYYNSTGQNPLEPEKGDFLPFCNQLNATMNFWIKGDPQPEDKWFFGECDTTGVQLNPLYLIGTHSSSGGTNAHWLIRQEQNTGPGQSTPMSDGTYQTPVPGYWTGSMGAWTASPVFDGEWHMLTVTCDSNASVSVFVDGVVDIGETGHSDYYGNPSCLPPLLVTNTYYTTNVYPYSTPPASNPPPHGYVKWMFDFFQSGSTTFGGFKRGPVPNAGAICQIDDIGFWNRPLLPEEIEFVMTNGQSWWPARPRPLRIGRSSYLATDPANGGNPSFALRWDSVSNATYTVQRKINLTNPMWTTLTNGLASGGDMTAYVDGTIGTGECAYYRIIRP